MKKIIALATSIMAAIASAIIFFMINLLNMI